MSMRTLSTRIESTGNVSVLLILIPMLMGDVLAHNPLTDWYSVAAILSHDEALSAAHDVELSTNLAFVLGKGGSFSPTVKKDERGIYANLGVVDISDPKRPRVVASHPFADTRETRGPNGLTISGKVVFLAGGETIDAVDIRNPRQPFRLGSQRLPASNIKAQISRKTDNAHDLVYRDGYLYVSCQSDNSLMILRITDREILLLADSI